MSSNPNQGNSAAGGNDYLDKAFNTVASKFGGAQGKKIAANKGLSEKIVRFLSTFLPFSLPSLTSLSLSTFSFPSLPLHSQIHTHTISASGKSEVDRGEWQKAEMRGRGGKQKKKS